MKNKIKIKFRYSTPYVGCEQEEDMTLEDLGITMDEWNKMSIKERDIELQDHFNDWLQNEIDMYYEICGGDGDEN